MHAVLNMKIELHWLLSRSEVLCDYTLCNWPRKYHCRRPTKFSWKAASAVKKEDTGQDWDLQRSQTPFCFMLRSRGCINHVERTQFVNLSPNWVLQGSNELWTLLRSLNSLFLSDMGAHWRWIILLSSHSKIGNMASGSLSASVPARREVVTKRYHDFLVTMVVVADVVQQHWW